MGRVAPKRKSRRPRLRPLRSLLLFLALLLGLRVGEASHPGPTCSFLDDPEDLWQGFDEPEDLATSIHSVTQCIADQPTLPEQSVDHIAWGGDRSDPSLLAEVPSGGVGSPMWRGDVGILEDHLAQWRLAEAALRLPSKSSASDRRPTKDVGKGKIAATKSPPPMRGHDFVAAKAFVGPSDGAVFKLGPKGLGYYVDSGLDTGKVATQLCLDELIAPPSELAAELTRVQDAPLSSLPFTGTIRKRARRARHPNGKRKKFLSRKEVSASVPSFFQGIPISSSIEDSSWKSKGLFAVDTANANSWSTLEDCVLVRSTADIITSQESKIFTDDRLDGASLAARAAGWNPILTSAHKTAALRGSGGMGIFARKGQAVADLASNLVPEGYQHRIAVGWVDAVLKGGIYVVSAWPKDSEGLSDWNMGFLEVIGSIIAVLDGPWLIGADWNIPPTALQESNWPSMVKGTICTSSLRTCNNSTYDYFVVADTIRHLVSGVQRLHDGGFNPHYGSRLLLRGNGRRLMVRKLVRAEKVPGVLPFGPPNQPPDYQKVFDATKPEQIEEATVTWLTGAREEFQDLLGRDLKFEKPHFVWAPATPSAARPWAGTSKRSIMWRTLAKAAQDISRTLKEGLANQPAHKIKLVVSQLASCDKVTRRLPRNMRRQVQHCVDCWVRSLKMAVAKASDRWVLALQKVADAKALRLERDVIRAKKDKWLVSIGAKPEAPGKATTPTKLAYRWTRGAIGWKQSPLGKAQQNLAAHAEEEDDVGEKNLFGDELVPDDQYSAENNKMVVDKPVPLSDQAAVQQEADEWASLWQVAKEYDEEVPLMLEPAALEKLAPWAISAAASTFPAATGVGADNVAPKAVARLSIVGLSALAHLFLLFEMTGSWTEALNLVLIVLLPKMDGGLRPIGLFPTPIRIWSRARVMIARAWESANSLPEIFGGKGMGAQRGAWEAAFIAEFAAKSGLEHVAALLDLVKAFKTVSHRELAEACIRLGYPPALLRLSLAAYRLLRAVGVDGVFAEAVQATRGITAGSGFATTELRLLLIELIWELKRHYGEGLAIKLYVDDLTLAVTGKKGQCLKLLDGAVRHAIDFLQERRGMEVSAKKSVALAGRPKIAKAFCKVLKSKVLKPVKQAKLLGTEFVGGRRRSTVVQRGRLHNFARRVPRFLALRKAGVNVVTMARAAATPAISYGVDVIGMADSIVNDARSLVCRTATPPTKGRSVDIALWALDGGNGTLDPMFDVSLLGLRHWCFAWWEGWFKPDILRQAFALAQDAIDLSSKTLWNKVAGPVAAMLASLHRIGWSFKAAEKVNDDAGHEWCLALDSPAAVLQAGRRAVRKWRLERALPGLAPSTLDSHYTTAHQGQSFLLDFADIIKTLCRVKGGSRVYPLWDGTHKGQMLSAVSGGQWPQARKASVKSWLISDSFCQLCKAEVGTIAHRFKCASTMPAEGWPAAPQQADRAIALLDQRRQEILTTRGLLVLRLPRLPLQREKFIWLWQAGEHWPEDTTWYIDGSMFCKEVLEYRTTGYSIVVHSKAQGLVAFGGGFPPAWCSTAAAAEAWALQTTLTIASQVPKIVTDCKGLLDAAKAGWHSAAAPSRVLARIWNMIATALDGDLQALVQILTWMPAHQTLAMVGNLTLPSGKELSVVDWRANRLADAIAKAFARDNLIDRDTLEIVTSARAAVGYHVSLLAKVTHAANNCQVPSFRKDGTPYCKCARDSVDDPSAKRKSFMCSKRGEPATKTPKVVPSVSSVSQPECEPVQFSSSSLAAPPAPPARNVPEAVLTKRRRLGDAARARKEAEEQHLSNRVSELGATLMRRPQSVGESRLVALQRRVKSRLN